MRKERAIVIILDSAGIGALPDAATYSPHDVGANTIANTAKAGGGLAVPNLQRMGLGNLADIAGCPPTKEPTAHHGTLWEVSNGKDTITGHWELMGIRTEHAFRTYPEGFPPEIINEFERLTGRKTIGNKPASGTDIIAELGEEHQKTGALIVYTSADSVFQIAAHEETVPLDDLYRYCQIARELLVGEHSVGRIIARPFIGTPGHYERVGGHRHDYAVEPAGKTLLDLLVASGKKVYSVGKIKDIFAGRGISDGVYTMNNADSMAKTLAAVQARTDVAMIFTNLVDFDMLYGHRRDVAGYKGALEAFDRALDELLPALRPTDVLVFSADHGCDPTAHGTDHTRERVPLVFYDPANPKGQFVGERTSMGDLGKTLAEMFGLDGGELIGTSFWKQISREPAAV